MEKTLMECKLSKIQMHHVIFYLAILAFKIILDYSYVNIIYPQYSYMGFVYVDDPMKVFTGFVFFFIMLFFIPNQFSKPSEILSTCIVTMMFIPTLTIFSYGDADYEFITINLIFWIILLCIVRYIPTVKFRSINQKLSKIIFVSGIFITCFYCCFFVIKTFGFNITFNIMDVYEQRELYKQANIPMSQYLFTWSANVIMPIGFMYLFLRKKYILSIFPIITLLLLFSATGMKSMLFTIPVVMIFAIFIKIKNVNMHLMLLLVASSIACILAFTIFDEILPISLLIRRVFLVPARISQYYFEFFKEAGQIRLGHSIFRGLTTYRFEQEPAKFISQVFLDKSSNFNCGIIADGFANFGYIGVFCWSIIIAFVFKLIDIVSYGKNKSVVVASIIMFISSLSNSALVTNLGTHGMLISIVMLYLLPNDLSVKDKINNKQITGGFHEDMYHDKCTSS